MVSCATSLQHCMVVKLPKSATLRDCDALLPTWRRIRLSYLHRALLSVERALDIYLTPALSQFVDGSCCLVLARTKEVRHE